MKRYTTKQWTSQDGRCHAGKPLTKNLVFRVLTNVLHAGKVNHKGQIFAGGAGGRRGCESLVAGKRPAAW